MPGEFGQFTQNGNMRSYNQGFNSAVNRMGTAMSDEWAREQEQEM